MSLEKKLKSVLDKVEVSWNCIHRRGMHEVGCPHKEWTKEQLLDALVSKKKFEQSGLVGTKIADLINLKPNHGRIKGIGG